MTQAKPSYGRPSPFYLILALALALWGCADSPQKRESTATQPAQPEAPPPQEPDLSLPPSQYSPQFQAAEKALDRFDWTSASSLLEPLQEHALSQNDRSYLIYLQARIEYIRGEQARSLQTAAALEQAGVHPSIQYRARELRRHALQLAGSNLESAQIGDQMLRQAPSEQHAELKREIWLDLARIGDDELQRALGSSTDLQWQGWLELALISRSLDPANTSDLRTWRDNNGDHPAAFELPGGLDLVLEQSTSEPSKVAIILPLSGRLAAAGRAVLDGYLASYYANRGSTGELLVLDLDRYGSITTAYGVAQTQGATMVVGPLSKTSVAELATLPHRPIPVLALNRTEGIMPATGQPLVQMSLSPEDEAMRVAELAFGRGARSALIFRPQGEWGAKLEGALRQRWEQLGGRIAGTESYGNREQYSPAVKSGLQVDQSETRARGIRDMLATNIEFTARRRQDVDAIFLLSRNGAEARAINPLLAFHYAGQIPVFSSSSVYSGIPDARDKDLNGIEFTEIPWLLGSNPGLRVAIAAGGTGSDTYTRLNALGADAFLLQSRYPKLQAGTSMLLRGNTGLLTMDEEQRLHRELSLATFDGDTIRPQ